jgi:TonB-linked SusC/RagA family outer membrane protein
MNKNSLFKGWAALYYPILFGLYLCCLPVMARTPLPKLILQQHTITGTVRDSQNVLPGVTVSVEGKSTATITDYQGKYSITATATDILVFSFVGYSTLTVPVAGRTIVPVHLQEDATQLQEVRINAGYYSVKESERTGSIAKITAKDIEKQPVTNVLATMQGRMAGVNITQTTGMPGGGFDVQIRGQNSLRSDGNSPMYIVDGVPYASEPIGSLFTSGHLPRRTSPLNSINPGDIESIAVLKDADATAIYGSRGANGVVLISTKRGKAGKTKFTGSVSSGSGHVTRFMKLMNTEEYLAMRREAYANDGVTDYPDNAYDINGTWDQNRYTNWQKELLGGNSSISTVQTSLSGGSKQTQFVLSGTYNKETTVFPGDYKYEKGNVHMNLNHESEDQRFRINFTTGYAVQNNTMPTADFMGTALSLAPNAPSLYDALGNLNWENGTFDNPLQVLATDFKGRTNDHVANSLLSYSLSKGFEIKSSFGYSDLRYKELNLLPSTMYNPAYGLDSSSSLVFENNTSRNSWIIEPQANYQFTAGQAKIDLLVGGTFQQQTANQVVHMGYGFASNGLIENPASASLFSIMNSDATVYKYQAFFGRANVKWKGRYIINMTGRRDGSSRFGIGNRFASFGAVGASWLFGDEPIIKNNAAFLSFGKLRASYGTTGNDQIGDYQYLDTYITSGSNYQGTSGLQPTRLFNKDFGWETNRKLEVALETGFLKDRIFLTAAWYRNRSSSQLVGVPLPGITGFTSIQANLDAAVQNSGYELTLRTLNLQGDKLSWTTNFNFTRARNKLLSFPDLEASPYQSQFVIGKPLNIVKVFHYIGLDPQTGTYQFQDLNGDGVLSANDDRGFVKELNPKFYGGLQNQLKYGVVQLDFLFQFVKQENYTEAFGAVLPGTMSNQPASFVSHWQNPGDSGPNQLYSTGINPTAQRANTLYSQSDAVIADASYIRLKTISLTYDLPKRWTKSFNCKLSVQGQNVLSLTSYKGADPEFKTAGFMPPLRFYSSTLQITF